MEPGRLLHHEQAQAAAVLAPGGVHLVKALEDALPVLRGDAAAVVPDGQHGPLALPAQVHPHMAVGLPVAIGVGDQVRQQPGQQGQAALLQQLLKLLLLKLHRHLPLLPLLKLLHRLRLQNLLLLALQPFLLLCLVKFSK